MIRGQGRHKCQQVRAWGRGCVQGKEAGPLRGCGLRGNGLYKERCAEVGLFQERKMAQWFHRRERGSCVWRNQGHDIPFR